MKTRIIPDDRLILYKFVNDYRPLSRAYEDSWGYIIQATRHNGFKYYNEADNTLIFFDKPGFKENTLIIPNFFGDLDNVINVVEDICRFRKSKVIFKNVPLTDIDNFNRYGFRCYRAGEFWSPESPYDDQTYPQTVIDLQAMSACRGRRYHKLKNLINRSNHFHNFELQPFSTQSKADVLRIFEVKDTQSCFGDRHAYFDAHQMYLDNTQGMDSYIVKESGRTEGFITLSAISKQAIALCAAISDCDDECIIAWGVYKVLCMALKNGFASANLGGSESANVFEFKKQTFKPSKFIERTHLFWDGQGRI